MALSLEDQCLKCVRFKRKKCTVNPKPTIKYELDGDYYWCTGRRTKAGLHIAKILEESDLKRVYSRKVE